MTAKIDTNHWIPRASPWGDAKATLGRVIPGDACPRGIQFYQFNIALIEEKNPEWTDLYEEISR